MRLPVEHRIQELAERAHGAHVEPGGFELEAQGGEHELAVVDQHQPPLVGHPLSAITVSAWIVAWSPATVYDTFISPSAQIRASPSPELCFCLAFAAISAW